MMIHTASLCDQLAATSTEVRTPYGEIYAVGIQYPMEQSMTQALGRL